MPPRCPGGSARCAGKVFTNPAAPPQRVVSLVEALAEAAALTQPGKPQAAALLARQIVTIRALKQGPEHLATLPARPEHSPSRRFQHRKLAAEGELRAILEIDLRVLGPEHGVTKAAQVMVKQIEQKLEQPVQK